MRDGRLGCGGFDQDISIVSSAQPAQAELSRSEVIDASLKIDEIAADQVQLDLIERSGASGGAKIDLSAWIFSAVG